MYHRYLQALFVVAIVIVLGGASAIVWQMQRSVTPSSSHPSLTSRGTGFARFTSAKDFSTYLTTSQDRTNGTALGRAVTDTSSGNFAPVGTKIGLGASETAGIPAPDRVSTTNIQVVGVDEPDIVKTDGRNIFVSIESKSTSR